MHIPSIHTKQRVRVVYALAFLLAASVTTQATHVFDGSALTGMALRQGDVVVPPKDEALRRRRTYQAVLKVCNERDGVVEGMVCPDVNDRRAVKTFLNDEPEPHAAAPAQDVLHRSNLSPEDRDLLDRYVGRQSCPRRLRALLPGFYELCQSIIVDPLERSVDLTTAQRRRAQRLQERMIDER